MRTWEQSLRVKESLFFMFSLNTFKNESKKQINAFNFEKMNKLFFQGDYIWIEPVTGKEFDVAIGARVVSAEGRRIQVKDDDNKVNHIYFSLNFTA